MRSFIAALVGLFLLAALAAAAPVVASAACDYSDADQNNGWGWDPDTRQSCAPRDGDTPAADGGGSSGVDGATGECVDTDGDGWGWDGSQSCTMPAPREAALPCDLSDADCDDPLTPMTDAEYMDYRMRQHIERLSGALTESDNHWIEMQLARERYEERQRQEQIHQEGPYGIPDADGDGVPDAQDDYPNDTSRHDRNDRDGDGVLNGSDAYPDDASRHEHQSLADEQQQSPATPGLGEPDRPEGECHGRPHC